MFNIKSLFYRPLKSAVTLAVIVALTLALLMATSVQAQGVARDSVTARALLDGYVNEALNANLAIAQQSAALRRATQSVREAHGRFLPSVALNARYSEFSGVLNIGDFINPAYAALNQLIGQERFPTNIAATLPFRQETKLELSMPLFNDALFGARAAARAQRDLVGSGRHAAMRQLAADVQQAWLGYATTVRAVETLEATLPVLDENVRVSERLIQNGQATPDVLLRARAERSELLQQLEETRRQRESARRSFNLLRNAPDDAAVTLVSDSTLTAFALLDRETLLSRALQRREELAQTGSLIDIARAQERVATSAFLPNLSLGASYGVQGDAYRFNRNNDVGLASLVLGWNLFNGTQDAARREQARASRTEAEFRRREAERAVRRDVLNAWDAVQAARSNLVTADDRYASAQRAFSLVQRRYAEGLATQIEFLSARSAFTGAALNQVITRFSFATRVVDLERAAALRSLPN
ncbi:MAG: TolC family protein [Gemmatimonas sp.]|jgi:outer membrane protein TolC|uniref:TolC family protein n=1 Tax=Gemmatimonas sp. TaxID=1962908 RepID=UPI0031C08166|nr:TolC family protein [Gemmatimonas sp.]